MVNYLQNTIKIFIFIAIAYLGFSIYLLDIRSVTWDDQSMYTLSSPFQFGINAAYSQARIAHFINALLMPVPYLLDNHIYFKSVQIITNILSVVSIGVLLSVLFKNRHLGYLYSALTLTLWQNSDGHNMMVSYPFYIGASIILLSISLILFVYYLRFQQKKYLLFSLIFWIFASKGSELYMLYTPLFLFVSYFESDKGDFKEKIKDSIVNFKWPLLVALALLIIYVLFRVSMKSVYGGTVVDFNLKSFLSSLITYAYGLAPGMQFYYNFKEYSILEIANIVDFYIVLSLILIVYVLINARKRIQKVNIKTMNYLLMSALYLVFSPVFLISLTTKYQYYVSYHGVNNYLYSSHSFFAIMFALVIVLINVKRRMYYYMLVFILAVIILLTQINNKIVGGNQARYSEKYFLLDALLESSYITQKKDGFIIAAPTLWDDMTVTKDYWIKDAWTRYAKKKTDKNIKIVRFPFNENSLINYVSAGKGGVSFLIYSEDEESKVIFLSSKKCNKLNSCYLNSITPSLNGSIMNDTFIAGGVIHKAQVLSTPSQTNSYGINAYHISDSMKSNQVKLLTTNNYNFNANKVVNFNEGFYSLEGDINNTWIWAFDNGKIGITSPKKAKVKLTVSLKAASIRNFEFKLNGMIHKVERVGKDLKDITFVANLNAGDNILRVNSDSDSIRLSQSDDRKFSYAIFDIKVVKFDKAKKSN